MNKRRTEGRPPAMVDVAAAAGVSHQTVSRVVNGTGKVAEATRARVLAAIEELGYRPNSVARALVTRRSGLLGVITTTSAHLGPSSMLLAVELAARNAGFLTVVAPLERFTPQSFMEVMDRFLSMAVEAILLIEPINDVMDEFDSLDVPVPVVATMSLRVGQRLGIPTATLDQRSGIRQAVEHLVDLGHTDIVHVSGQRGWYEADAREAGYRLAMEEFGLEPRIVGGMSWDAAEGHRLGLELSREGLPTGIVAANDELSFGLIGALSAEGLRVPEDVSVVGFDDIPAARFALPALTTVRQDFSELGRRVVAMAVEVIRGETPVESEVIPVELVVRASSGLPRGG